MITLYYYPGNASFAPHAVLNEIGATFTLRLVDREHGEHRSPAYLALNPNGSIPVMLDGDLVLYETAAILLHLVDRFPQAHLAPPVGTVERAHFYKWMAWLTNTLQPRLMHYFYPERLVDGGDPAVVANLKARAERDVVAMLKQIDDQLAAHGGPWLLGTGFSAADVFAALLCRWTRGFASKPARTFARIGVWLPRVFARDAVRKTVDAEKLAAPLY